MRHNWMHEHTVIIGTAPCSYYRCSLCEAKFDHWYHEEPSIYAAMAIAGVPDECKGKP